MNKSNTQQLIRDFPYLYRLARAGTRETMKYGFQCADGWFQLIYELSAKIEERARAAGLDPKSDEWPAAAQVKEKFAQLRFYMNWTNKVNFGDLISEASAKSSVTCESCGKPGVLRNKSWMYVYCDACDVRRSQILARADVEWQKQENAGGYRAVIDEAFARADADELLKNPLVAAVAKGLAEYDNLAMEAADVKSFWSAHGILNVLEFESDKLISLLLLLKCPARLAGRYDDKQFVEAKRLAELVRFDLLERLTVKSERGELVLNLSEIANAADVVEKSYL